MLEIKHSKAGEVGPFEVLKQQGRSALLATRNIWATYGKHTSDSEFDCEVYERLTGSVITKSQIEIQRMELAAAGSDTPLDYYVVRTTDPAKRTSHFGVQDLKDGTSFELPESEDAALIKTLEQKRGGKVLVKIG